SIEADCSLQLEPAIRTAIRLMTWCSAQTMRVMRRPDMIECSERCTMRRAAMETSVKNKWQIRGAVLLIFVVGFVAGALTMNVYRARQVSAGAASHRGRFERVMEQLHLSAE